MVYMSHKKGIGLCIVVMFLCISCFGVKAYAPSFQRDMRQITNPYDDFTNLTKIQLKGVCYDFDETHHIGQLNHLGPLWFSSPSSVLTFRFRKDFELILNSTVQDTDPPMDVFVFHFRGFCLSPFYYKHIARNMDIFLVGYCERCDYFPQT